MASAASTNRTAPNLRRLSPLCSLVPILGIFNIQMPLIYGERGKAFRRLQEKITKVSDN
ncbi:hypothetical protein BGZ57DRAFT_892642 [Hyaloscypha finlandica]|nr:hypothetical protein BGZ57DRAFT_892642 [Hyaloscypha finlandica]